MGNWDDLRIFLVVARAKRIASAARALGIDATTVTRRLARLATAAGVPLFETIGGDRRLSEAGEALLTQAETIEAAILSATGRIGSIDVGGHVRLSLAEGLATHVVAKHIAAFAKAHSRLRLDLITASGFLDPSKREADVAVMLARPRNRQLRAEPLAEYRLGLYAAPACFADTDVPRNPADLRDHVMVGYVPEHIHAPELDYLPDVHDGLSATIRSTSINVQHALVRHAAGIGILPRFIAEQDGALMPVMADRITLSRTFWLVTHRETHSTPRIQAVISWLKEIARSIE